MRTTPRSPFLAVLLVGTGLAAAQAPAPTSVPAGKPTARKTNKPPVAADSAKPSTDREKILYTMGAMLGFPVSSLELTDTEIAWIRQGLTDSAEGRALRVPAASWIPKVSDFTHQRLADVAASVKAKDGPIFQRESAQPGTVRHPSGLLFRELRAGTKPGPGKTGQVFVAYTGKLTDGTVFDSSAPTGRPIVFDMQKVIPCWQVALPLMKAGGRARIVCPPELAWGDVGNPPLVKPGATVIFDLELVEVLK
jgi:FKBP-type peptidyl-prolyl cis-trans isomerase FkpA